MPKINGRKRRVLEGEYNPRHYIMIQVGTGNRYCRNCRYLLTSITSSHYCGIFSDNKTIDGHIELKAHPHYGSLRCQECLEAEKMIQEIKDAAKKEGEDTAFYRTNSRVPQKSNLINTQAR